MNRELSELKTALRAVLTSTGHPHPKFAVILPLVVSDEGTYLLVEVRAAGIFQAGDPCFPGGKIEEGETQEEAAVREMEEELGIRVETEDLLGQLPSVGTHLGSLTNIFVCVLSPEETENLVLSENEVAELLKIPMDFFMEDPTRARFYYEGHDIWGMTAGAIRHFCGVWKQISDDFSLNHTN